MDPTLILLVIALGAFIVFQVFQGRKRRRETENRQSKFLPGIEIMTNYGLYGTILSVDEETNVATIETTPGTVLKIHRQTILKVADYEVEAATETDTTEDRVDELDAADDEFSESQTDSGKAVPMRDAEFGERLGTDEAPTRESSKKVDE